MCLLSDFFIASDEELRGFDFTRSPVLSLPTVLARGLNCSDVFRLQAIVDGSFWRQMGKDRATAMMCVSWHYYPSLLGVRGDVVGALAVADNEELALWAGVWLGASRRRDDDFTPERIVSLVKDMAGLARQACERGCDMYVWMWDGPVQEEGQGTYDPPVATP